jgi:hypothetical protein
VGLAPAVKSNRSVVVVVEAVKQRTNHDANLLLRRGLQVIQDAAARAQTESPGLCGCRVSMVNLGVPATRLNDAGPMGAPPGFCWIIAAEP